MQSIAFFTKPFPPPKKGKARLLHKSARLQMGLSLKSVRRTIRKKKIPYTLSVQKGREGDIRNKRFQMLFAQLAQLSEGGAVKEAYKMGMAMNLEGTKCPRCKVGTLGRLTKRAGRRSSHKCHKKSCQSFTLPWHHCPALSKGNRAASMKDQLLDLSGLVTTNSVTQTITLTGHSRKQVARVRAALLQARKIYVHRQEKQMLFGGKKDKWPDVEVDEATVGKALVRKPKHRDHNVVSWENWLGLVKRGFPKSLVLVRLRTRLTTVRAPGPGPIPEDEWRSIGQRFLAGRKIVMHTDSARAYRNCRLKNVVKDHVVHKKRRVVNSKGKATWLSPIYAKDVKHVIDGKRVARKAGTQVIDRAWRSLKSNISKNQTTRPGSRGFALEVRSAQFEYWNSKEDPWVALGVMCRDFMP